MFSKYISNAQHKFGLRVVVLDRIHFSFIRIIGLEHLLILFWQRPSDCSILCIGILTFFHAQKGIWLILYRVCLYICMYVHNTYDNNNIYILMIYDINIHWTRCNAN